MLLPLGLRIGHVLAIGDHSSRDRRLKRFRLRWSALFELLIAQPHVFFTRTGTPCRVGHRSLRLLIVPKPKPFARDDDSNGWEGILTLTGGAWSKRRRCRVGYLPMFENAG